MSERRDEESDAATVADLEPIRDPAGGSFAEIEIDIMRLLDQLSQERESPTR